MAVSRASTVPGAAVLVSLCLSDSAGAFLPRGGGNPRRQRSGEAAGSGGERGWMRRRRRAAEGGGGGGDDGSWRRLPRQPAALPRPGGTRRSAAAVSGQTRWRTTRWDRRRPRREWRREPTHRPPAARASQNATFHCALLWAGRGHRPKHQNGRGGGGMAAVGIADTFVPQSRHCVYSTVPQDGGAGGRRIIWAPADRAAAATQHPQTRHPRATRAGIHPTARPTAPGATMCSSGGAPWPPIRTPPRMNSYRHGPDRRMSSTQPRGPAAPQSEGGVRSRFLFAVATPPVWLQGISRRQYFGTDPPRRASWAHTPTVFCTPTPRPPCTVLY